MTAAEIGKGQEMTDNEFAIRESECNSSAESYFEARPFLLSQHCYRIFDAGFERGWQAALAAPDYPLPDSLYPNSKDWLAGDYADRVEWLHMMYESKRQEVEALLAAPQPAAPVQPPKFPTMLRKMWSGSEVQQWINDNWEPKC